MEDIRSEIEKIADGQIEVDSSSVSYPYRFFAPEEYEDGEGIVKKEISYGPAILMGNRGTMIIRTSERPYDSRSLTPFKTDEIRLWMEKIDGRWQIVDFVINV